MDEYDGGYNRAAFSFVSLLTKFNKERYGKIVSVRGTGSYIHTSKENLYWFEHIIHYSTCESDCKGHDYWGCHVPHLRGFDLEAGVKGEMLGYRVTKNTREILDGSWADGGVYEDD